MCGDAFAREDALVDAYLAAFEEQVQGVANGRCNGFDEHPGVAYVAFGFKANFFEVIDNPVGYALDEVFGGLYPTIAITTEIVVFITFAIALELFHDDKFWR